jgi:hypothetical protein
VDGCGGDAVTAAAVVRLETAGGLVLLPWRRKESRAEKSLCESFCFLAMVD